MSPTQRAISVVRQFEERPYPDQAEVSEVLGDPGRFHANLAGRAFLARDGSLPSNPLRILDAGCGTGLKTIILEAANPGATVIGIDPSCRSIDAAEVRCRRVGAKGASFVVGTIEDAALLELGLFDYINCDEVLYLTEDPLKTLIALRQLLKPRGILRANLHNERQRGEFIRAQRMCELFGIADLPSREAAQAVRELYGCLHPATALARSTGGGVLDTDQGVFANHLLRGDTAFSIDETFAYVADAGLALVGMVDEVRWRSDSIFRSDNPKAKGAISFLESLGYEDRLRAIALIAYGGRLFDFWCCLPEAWNRCPPFSSWSREERMRALIHLHPVLQEEAAREEISAAVSSGAALHLGCFLPSAGKRMRIGAGDAELLHHLAAGPITTREIAQRWLKIHPRIPLNGRLRTAADAEHFVECSIRLLEGVEAVFAERV